LVHASVIQKIEGVPMSSRRHVPIIAGLVCFGVFAFLMFKWPGFGFWSTVLGAPFLVFGWVSVRFGFSASDKEVREMTDPHLRPPSRETSEGVSEKLDRWL
jgi:uncharacterized membrane protein